MNVSPPVHPRTPEGFVSHQRAVARPGRVAGAVCVIALLAAGLAVGCKPTHADGPSPGAAPPPPLVTVARPAVYPVQNYYDYNGHLEAVETVEIRARVKGFLEKVFFKEGDEVKVGDPLYVIDPREFQSAVSRSKSDIARAVADAASAEAQVLLATAELSRIESLGTSGTKSELDKAKATLAANKAAVDVAAANKRSAEAALRTAELQLSYTDIKSPIAGKISRTLVTAGNLVGGSATDTLLTTIVSQDPVYVYFDAPERDLIEYRRGVGKLGTAAGKQSATAADAQPGTGKVLVGVETENGFPHAGAIDFIENRVDSGTATVRLRGVLPNLKGENGQRVLYPGLFARVRLPVGSEVDRPVIPEEALMTGQEGRFVYVVKKAPDPKDPSKQIDVVKKQSVKVGATVWRMPPPDDKTTPRWQLAGGQPGKDGTPPVPAVVRSVVAIEGGLTADEVVIVNGLQKARPMAPVTPDERKFTPPPK